MNTPGYAPTSLPYKDRSAGLLVFGVLTLLLGVMCAMFVPVILFVTMAGGSAGQPAPDVKSMLPVVAFYGLLAVVLIWLGIGSMKARRWARALLLIFSWSAVIFGTLVVTALAIILPSMLGATNTAGQQTMSGGEQAFVTIFAVLFYGAIFVVIPAVWVFFYRSPHVKATCEARDPMPRWTDRCPLPVLAVCLWMAAGVPMMLVMPFTYPIFPFFGEFLTGTAGSAGFVVTAILWAWCAWGMYQLKEHAWWLALGLLCAFVTSHVMTYLRHDVMEIYVLMGFPEQQLNELKSMSDFLSGWMVWGVALFFVPYLGYMIWIKKFFRAGARVDAPVS